jgi:hypothetical protein
MPQQLPQQVLEAIDRLADKCIKDRIFCIDMDGEGTLKTFFSKQMLADRLRKEFDPEIEDALQGAYSYPAKEIATVHVKAAFHRFVKEFSFDAIQQQISARLERRVADHASDLSKVIRADWVVRPIGPHGPPTDPSVTELRLFLWL